MTDNLYNEILNSKDMTNTIDRDSLQEAYIQNLIDGMDYKTMERFVYDTLNENLTNYSDEELITEVSDYYPELLEGWLTRWIKSSIMTHAQSHFNMNNNTGIC